MRRLNDFDKSNNENSSRIQNRNHSRNANEKNDLSDVTPSDMVVTSAVANGGKVVPIKRSNQKKKSRKNLKRRLFAFFAGAAALYIVAAVITAMIGHLSTTTALNGLLTEGFKADGYIFREQTVVNAPCGGVLECMVSDGDRISEGQTIGYIYSAQPSADTVKQLKELNMRLATAGISGKEETYNSSIYGNDAEISSYIRDMSDSATERNIKTFADKVVSVETRLKAKTDDGDQGKTVEELTSEINSLNQSAGLLQTITAEKGGVFCPRTDGMEEKLDYSKALEATPPYLKELDGAVPVISQNVEAGQPLFKIINNYTWYFAANIDKKQAETLKEGQNVNLEFFDLSDMPVSGRIAKISNEDGGDVTVVVSTNKYVKGIYSTNKINCDIVTVSVEGIKLPVSCLRVKDGTEGVFVVRLDRAKFVPVSVKYKNNEWAVVSPVDATGDSKLKIYDEVIVDAKSVEDEKIVR